MSELLPQISVDTNVVSAIVRENQYASEYLSTLRIYDPMLTFFVRGELAAASWNRARQRRLDSLLARFGPLPLPTEETIEAFRDAMDAAVELHFGGSIGADLWIVAQTKEYGLPLLSHDASAIRTADRAGIPFITFNERALDLVRADRAAAMRG